MNTQSTTIIIATHFILFQITMFAMCYRLWLRADRKKSLLNIYINTSPYNLYLPAFRGPFMGDEESLPIIREAKQSGKLILISFFVSTGLWLLITA